VRKAVPYIAVAPMMDWTDRHCRYFHRLISPHVHLYTEMVTTGALLHGDRDRHLRFNAAEHPVALQLGGNDPAALAECARMGADYGYNEINLNCGCPSDRVQNGAFGACLMAQPETVAAGIAAMRAAVAIPVTVKCRIGIDDCDEFPFLNRFISIVSQAGCERFIIHARKAWLQGLSPKENREVPPLRYDIVAAIKDKYPHQQFVLNGGIAAVDDMKKHLQVFDGIMIGREAYQNPYILAAIERDIFGAVHVRPRETIARAMTPYIEAQARRYGTPAKTITRHMLGLYNGLPGARAFRRALSEQQPVEAALAALRGRAPAGAEPESFAA
jgi:tRNA-dihydrouridine synthase A